jgi:hypothetical protein
MGFLIWVIIFYSVRFLSKKSNQTEIFFLKKTETEPKPVQTSWFRFGSVFLFGFFPVWVRFGFFGFRLIKMKPN